MPYDNLNPIYVWLRSNLNNFVLVRKNTMQ